MIRVLLLEDDDFWRASLKEYLEGEKDIFVVGAVATREEAVQIVRLLEIDVAVLDVMLNQEPYGGLDAAEEILYLRPQTKVIMLTSLVEREVIISTFAIGAANFIDKASYADLPEAIRSAYSDQSPVHSSAAGVLRSEFQRIKTMESSGVLTPTEKEILQYIYQGYTQKAIQGLLQISRNTVKNHVTNILRKLNLKSSKEAAAMAAKKRWII